MKKCYQIFTLLILAALFKAPGVKAQTFTTVYVDTFNGEGVGPCGIPAIVAGPTGSAPPGFANGQIGGWDLATGSTMSFNPNYLACYAQGGSTVNAWGQWTSEVVDVGGSGSEWYLAPFRAKLSTNVGLVTWAFNMRTSYAEDGNFSFNDNEVLVVLGSGNSKVFTSGSDIATANGYAVTFTSGGAPYGVRLIKYTGGISGTSAATNTPTVVIAPTATVGVTSPTDYLSVKVTYDPSSNTWKLYVRDDGAVAFANPWTGVTTLVGSAVDATYTGMTMTNFGYYAHYHITGASSSIRYAYFDNYRVTVDCTLPINGPDSVCVGGTINLTNGNAGGVWSSTVPTVGTIGTTGVVTGISPGTTTISYDRGPGCVITKIVTVRALPTIGGTLSVCEGATTALTGTPSGGTWVSSVGATGTIGSATGVLTGIAAGTTTITFTSSVTSCSNTAVATVNALPGIISGPTSVCVNSTITLSSSPATGTWSISPAGFATIDAGGVVTGTSPGTATVSYTFATGCRRTYVVTINAIPAAIAGTLSVCVGATTALTDITPGGTWSSSVGAVGTIGSTSGILTGITAGTTTTTFTLATGCYITAVATVNPTPAPISGPTAVCMGATITLNTTSTGGGWSISPAGFATIDASGVVTGTNAGTTVVSYSFATGCQQTYNITVNAAPAAIGGTLSLCVGSTSALTDATPGGTWSSSVGAVGTIGSATGVLTGISSGTTTTTFMITATGCFTTAVATVNPVPAAITGTMTVCVGSATTLSTTSTGGAWSSSNDLVATVGTSGIVTGVATGTVTISYTFATGCYTTAVVTVNPAPAPITGPSSVCIGFTITLSQGTPGGTWSSNNTNTTAGASTGYITGNLAGTSIITYSINPTCYVSTTVTVNSLPPAISGTLSVCVGSTTALTSGAGGVWAITPATVATISPTGVVTGILAGTATVSYTAATGCYRTAVVTVNPLPAVITGPGTVCEGANITLSSTTGGGAWTSSTGSTTIVSLGTAAAITGASSGTSVISYRLAATGCQQTRTITVNPLPVGITGPASLCVGATASLSTTSTGGVWSSSVIGVGTIDPSGVVTGIGTGTTTISYTLPTTCYVTRVETVNTTPSALITPIGDTTFCPGGFVVLTANTGVGLTYQWSDSGTPIFGAVSSTHTATTGGSYQVTVSNGIGCSATSAPVNVTVDAVTASITTATGSTVGCTSGLLLNATAGTGLTYQWELAGVPVAGETNANYTATVSGDYSVVISNATGCSATDMITLTLYPSPSNVITLSGPLTFCAGGSLTMTASSGTGYTYQWFNASGPIAGATDISYTATASGSYSATITNPYGCNDNSAAMVVVVNPLPNVAIMPATYTVFCAGSSIVLNATAAAGLTYRWFLGGAPIPGATNAAYTALTSGGYRVEVTNTATGCIDTTGADTVVTAVSAASITPLTPPEYCWGGSVWLSSSVLGASGAITYQWYRDDASGTPVPISGAIGSSYNATIPGKYTLQVNIAGAPACSLMSSKVDVIEHPLPNPVVAYNSATHVFTSQTYYVSYQWFKNLVAIPGATAYSTIATSNGNYKVQVIDTNGCQSFAEAYILSNFSGGGGTGSGSTGVGAINKEDVQIYPNPAADVVHISAPQAVRAVVRAIDGRSLINVDNATDIDIRNLADGIYTIMIYTGNDQLIKAEKLVKATR